MPENIIVGSGSRLDINLENTGQASVVLGFWIFETDSKGNRAAQLDYSYLVNSGQDSSLPLKSGIYLCEWVWSSHDTGAGASYEFFLTVNEGEQDHQTGLIDAGSSANGNGFFTLTVS